ncbi:class D beta-lactamase [Merismopedia glauca]|uniref:Beta-lactamase n=1 Tax=Merismopedia glauca CCAP 1448/3 TaxID=1296344 RepID=A0A2T1CA81_9CYAN|nr:class D beta-lactamase [Merismopedia glauca]PSB05043.1 class D beta-lactamase [Merismopedia glauca CCAP 1448/3]
MNKIFHSIAITLATLTSATSAMAKTPDLTSVTPNSPKNLPVEIAVAQEFDFGRHFKQLGIQGSIIIYDRNRKRFHEHNLKRNVTRFSPASTFKIPNSLISLETKAISDEKEVINWDGVFREIDDWNQDLNIKEAFKFSAVWFYQVLARRVGYERMQQWLKKAKYGNQKIGSKEQIDRFWLDGTLQISPREQVLFMQRLYENKLPFSKRSLSIVKDIMVMEKKPNYTIRAKTGWFGFGTKTKPQIGWYVGYLEKGKNVYFFATNIDIRQEKDAAARKELTYRCLKEMGLL